MSESEIAAAAATCLSSIQKDDRPFYRLSAYLTTLKADPAWSDGEIVEVQTRVIRTLMQQMGKPD